ncbi:MAG TPA: FAD:protein FMN transferase [Thermomicrobiales bacterium]|nr:FAD:protein FMN transferase [Thermomicrobiales bacterium]
MSGGGVHTHAFDTMGSTVELVLTGRTPEAADVAFTRAKALADRWERVFSRFRPESELSRLNRNAASFRPSRLLFDGIEAAIEAARLTEGRFDPTVLPALISLGYDRPYARIVAAGGEVAGQPCPVEPAPCGRWREVLLDRSRKLIQLPEGVQLDLGGIAKGLYADHLAGELAAWPGGMVSAGGDMRIWGEPPDGDRWIVGIEEPERPGEDIAWFEVKGGGVATSGTNRRHWRLAGEDVHHLIDPATGRPVAGDLRSVTVAADTAVAAEVAATALFVAGGATTSVSALTSMIWLAVGVECDGQIRMLYQSPRGHTYAASDDAA